MRRIFLQSVLLALLAACSEGVSTPHKEMPAFTPNFATSAAGSGAAAHSVLCSNASGSVFVREQCHANEQQLDVVALGLVGPPGPGGTSGYQIVAHQDFVPPGVANVHVNCPAGKRVLGGGFDIETPDYIKVFSSEPSDGAGNLIDNGWNVLVQNAGSSVRQTTVIAICALVQ